MSTRDKLVRLLRRRPGLDSTVLAQRLGVSPQRIRQLLKAIGAVRQYGWRLPDTPLRDAT